MLKKRAVTGQMIQLGWKPPALKTFGSSCFSFSVLSMGGHLLAFLLRHSHLAGGEELFLFESVIMAGSEFVENGKSSKGRREWKQMGLFHLIFIEEGYESL